jgi:hypothetical protein
LLAEVRFFCKSTGFTSSTFPIQPDFSQNQPATITLNTGSPRTLGGSVAQTTGPLRNYKARSSRLGCLEDVGALTLATSAMAMAGSETEGGATQRQLSHVIFDLDGTLIDSGVHQSGFATSHEKFHEQQSHV